MKILLIWLFSFLIAGVIISPFFWLRFLKKDSKLQYLIFSLIITLGILYFSIEFLYDFILKYIHQYNQLDYFDGISMGSLYVVLLFIILFPFLFTKIYFGKIKLRSFILSLVCSIIIFISLFLYWAYVLLPKAFVELNNYF